MAKDIATPSMQATAATLRGLADMIEGASGHISADSAWTMYRALNRLADNLDAARAMSDMRQAIEPLLRRGASGRNQ